MRCNVCDSEYGHVLSCPALGVYPVLDLQATKLVENTVMFLAMYESRKVSFPEGDVWVTRFPNDEYGCSGDDDEGVYKGFGDTPLAAIADYHAVVESEG